MKEIYYIDRETKTKKKELIYGEKSLLFLYGDKKYFNFLSNLILTIFCKFSFFSRFYGWIQKKSFTKKKVRPFILKYNLNESEFKKKEFTSFNDFFTRKLTPDARPINLNENVVIMPADGRYLAYQNFEEINEIFVKKKSFTLQEFLKDSELAKKYAKSTVVIGRLCPVDYHRFHFPIDCIPNKAKLINGRLHSVNPIALWKNMNNLSENKRAITLLKNKEIGDVVFVEIGAINVGSIHQTYIPNQFYQKGLEKGYFSFGGSCIVMLFEASKIKLDHDLIAASQKKIEIYAKMGQSIAIFNSRTNRTI
jgi:phosphatidylserine decarboxylase